jgi:riboflavin kinase/FMN adenylyltransferase
MNYIITGKVIRGDGYGKKLGFPTVNLETQIKYQSKEFPLSGVYAGMASVDGIEYRAGIVVGPNDKIEAHLIGYDGDAYGKVVTLEINKFLRPFKNFDTEEELISQIKEDIRSC